MAEIDFIKVLHLSTHNEECGIAKFQQNIVDGMGEKRNIVNTFFPVSPNKIKLMNESEFNQMLLKLDKQLTDFHILHIQHEYSFYASGQLQRIVNVANAKNKRILFTLHTPPHAHRQGIPRTAPRGRRPRTYMNARRVSQDDTQFVNDYIRPLFSADLLIAMSKASIESFVSYGVPDNLIKLIVHPVPRTDRSVNSHEITQKLNREKGDTILSTVGFLSEAKGIIKALKALTILPESYKLAIVGGSHPSGQNNEFYDHVCDEARELGLLSRIYITGYVADDAKRDALLRETDICLYPYNKAYYDYVSSGALTNAIANDLPIVAFRTKTFTEADELSPFINFAQADSYYELARTIQSINREKSTEETKKYADMFSIEKQAALFAECYLNLAGN